MKRVLLLLAFVTPYSAFAQTAPAPTTAKPEAAAAAKPAPTVESLTAEVASLKAQLASAQAENRLVEVQANLQLQVCASPDLMTARLAAQEARKASDKLKPTSK